MPEAWAVVAGYAGLVLLALKILRELAVIAGDVAVTKWKVEELWRWYQDERGRPED